jgi:hypothetical protein
VATLSWLFDFLTAVGKVDRTLGQQLGELLRRQTRGENPESWEPPNEDWFDRARYEEYSGELFGVLVSLTQGGAKEILRGMVEKGLGRDGYKALAIFNRRYDSKTAAGLLQSYMEVTNPKQIKSYGEVAVAIDRWETKLGSLKMRYDEELSGNLKLAI